MNKAFSHVLSVAFHPVFINLLNLWLLFTLFPALSYGIPLKMRMFYISIIFVSTSIIPLVMVLLLRFTGRVHSVMLNQKEDRRIPYLVTLVMYFFNYYNFNANYNKYPTHPMFLSYLIACAAIIAVVMAVNFFNKISIHTATLGALAGVVAVAARYSDVDTRLLLAIVLLLTGLVATARVFLNSHQNLQVYSGFLLGFFLMFFIL